MNVIEQLKPILERYAGIRFAYLFGSRALGYERPDSDVDLAVSFAEGASARAEVSVAEELAEQAGVPVQVVSLDRKLPPRLMRNILKTGLLLKDGRSRQHRLVVAESPELSLWRIMEGGRCLHANQIRGLSSPLSKRTT